jgi:hypothetical protein
MPILRSSREILPPALDITGSNSKYSSAAYAHGCIIRIDRHMNKLHMDIFRRKVDF